MAVRVGYLCDHPIAIPILADVFRQESPEYFRDWSEQDVIERLLEPTLQRNSLPLTLVAFSGDALAGTVAVRPDSITTHAHLGPWLAALHVLAPFRGRGLGAMLIRSAEKEAARLGYSSVYAGSGAAAPLFTRLGWETVEHVTYCGSPIAILRRTVA